MYSPSSEKVWMLCKMQECCDLQIHMLLTKEHGKTSTVMFKIKYFYYFMKHFEFHSSQQVSKKLEQGYNKSSFLEENKRQRVTGMQKGLKLSQNNVPIMETTRIHTAQKITGSWRNGAQNSENQYWMPVIRWRCIKVRHDCLARAAWVGVGCALGCCWVLVRTPGTVRGLPACFCHGTRMQVTGT